MNDSHRAIVVLQSRDGIRFQMSLHRWSMQPHFWKMDDVVTQMKLSRTWTFRLKSKEGEAHRLWVRLQPDGFSFD